MRTAIDRAWQAWTDAKSPRNFNADLGEHLRYGFVVSQPHLFAMGRPVKLDAPESELARISCSFETPDAWLIWSAAGDLADLVGVLPFWLPSLAFHRGNARRTGPQPLRVYALYRVLTLARHLRWKKQVASTPIGL